ncbi:dipeptide ABC transporter ATP-binding protein [Paractinoplanes brasiliensis]|uniref:dipeptide ABC transporter ATP-binding protein n=2 Tax=Paractinoplanes brasiliensis TaxID=52695 RepID=UPI001FB762DD|nr:ABC transporter ATP-binding protein [Actinoplanes brasiliensis]
MRDLHVTFPHRRGDVHAVRGIDLDIHRGECVAIVGESGSGKSVTARTLVGLAGPNARISSTRFKVDGRSGPFEWRTLRGGFAGLVLQDALVSLDPLRTVGAEISEVLRVHNIGKRHDRAQRVRSLLEAVHVPEPGRRARQHPHQLSGGLRQRALIASALAAGPPLLIADEPTTALDVTVQAQILDLLAERHTAGETLLLISHDLAVVSRLADRVLVMKNGRVVESGDTRTLLTAPSHPYTQQLLTAVPSAASRGRRLSHPSSTATPPPPPPSTATPPPPSTATPSVSRSSTASPHPSRSTPSLSTAASGLSSSSTTSPPLSRPAPPLSTAADGVSSLSTAADGVSSLSTAADGVSSLSTAADGVSSLSTAADGVSSLSTAADGVSSLSTAADGVSSLSTAADGVSPPSTAAPGVSRLSTGEVGVVVEAVGLRKRYSSHTVVDGVDLTVRRGEIVGLVGESGSGKTTVAQLLFGLTAPTSGSVAFEGAPWTGLSERRRRPWRRRLQLVSQDPLSAFDPRWTVERIVREALPKPEPVLPLLERVGLSADVLERYPRQLSGGQRQRVAIARALAPRPSLIICDEPVSALDVSVQAQVLDLLAEIRDTDGTALLFISHDLGVVHHLADRVLVMRDGAVVEQGPVDDVFHHPQHEYTRALIAAVPTLEVSR